MITPILKRHLSRFAKRIEGAAYDPRPAQEAALGRLVARGRGSEVARRLGLTEVRSSEDARNLPATDYRALEPELARAFASGRRGIFGPSRIVAFGQTSGSTGEPKRLPINADFLASYQRSTQWMAACLFYSTGEWESVLSGKRLTLAARPVCEASPTGVPVGFVSGIMTSRAPLWLRWLFLPSAEVLRLPTWDEKMKRVLDEARRRDVRMVIGIPAIVASFTQKALAHYRVESLSEIWPELRFCVYGGTALSAQMRLQFERQWCGTSAAPGKRLVFWELYQATEGQFGHTFHPDWPGMVFNPFENFYQFSEQPQGPFLHLHELDTGKRYFIFVTTPGGLVNYRMGDQLEITSSRPLTFRVCGRESEELSVATEKITPDQLSAAVDRAWCDSAAVSNGRLKVSDFAVWLDAGAPNRLVWAVGSPEASEIRFPSDAHELAKALDHALQATNPSYRELRINDLIYAEPKIAEVPIAVFERYRDRNLDRGQFKAKRLFRSREEFERTYLYAGGSAPTSRRACAAYDQEVVLEE